MSECPACGTEPEEYQSMIDYFVSIVIREVICQHLNKKLGIGVMNVRNLMMEHLKDEREAPENIRIWFKNIDVWLENNEKH